MEELKPCPFCGGEPKIIRDESFGYYDDTFIECNKCSTMNVRTIKFKNVGWSKSKGNVFRLDAAVKEAIAAWNTRHTSEQWVNKQIEIYAWLGYWRDYMPIEAVCLLQDLLGHLPQPPQEKE